MAKKRNKYPPESWETTGEEKYTRIYDDKMLSVAFTELKPRQRYLYVCMKSMYKGKDWNPNGTFAFPWGMAQKHHLYTNRDLFYHDIDALISAGFIDLVEHNKYTRCPNIYRYSARWKEKGLLQNNTTRGSKNDTQKE